MALSQGNKASWDDLLSLYATLKTTRKNWGFSEPANPSGSAGSLMDDADIATLNSLVTEMRSNSFLANVATGITVPSAGSIIRASFLTDIQNQITNINNTNGANFSFGTNTSNNGFGTNTSNFGFGTNTSNFGFSSNGNWVHNGSNFSFGTNTGNFGFGTNTGNFSFGTNTSNFSFGTNTSNNNFGTNTSNNGFGTNTSNNGFGTNTSNNGFSSRSDYVGFFSWRGTSFSSNYTNHSHVNRR